LRQKVARSNEIELVARGHFAPGNRLGANRLGEWAAAGQAVSCVRLCWAPATLDKAVEMKVSFYPAPSKDRLR
jgi:hypothetical protein